jgi:hypothetical protein
VFGGGSPRTQQSLQPSPQICGANQVRFCGLFVRFDQANAGPGRQKREEFCFAFGIELESGVKFQHSVRILEVAKKSAFQTGRAGS